MRVYDVPGAPRLQVEHLVLDLNGTLSGRGELLPGVPPRVEVLVRDLTIHLATADTRGTASRLAAALPVDVVTISHGREKVDLVRRLGPLRTIAIGNGRNDAAMLRLAALGIVVIGPEGAAGSAVGAADLVCVSILDALDILIDEHALASTLRP